MIHKNIRGTRWRSG